MVSVLHSLGYRARLRAVDPHVYLDKGEDSRVGAQTGYYSWVTGYPSAADFIPPAPVQVRRVRTGLGRRDRNISEFCDPAIDEKMARATTLQVHDPAAATVIWQQAEQPVRRVTGLLVGPRTLGQGDHAQVKPGG